jgi:lipopolysaccharide/colanic/teichoic acid biosynthesis glycosyltransferase
LLLKRIFDIIVSSITLILLWPFIVTIGVLIRLDSKGPIFFVQKRVGKDGKLFNCIKFRTMVINSEKKGTITSATDNRITSIGAILRRYKLDEFPQLWNVLWGKMSFVGPRPDVPGYADKLRGEDRKILLLRPGITGPASLYFRNEEVLLTKVGNAKQFNDTVIWPLKVKINLEYLDTWSIWKDIGYILITLLPVLNIIFRIVKDPPRKPEDCIA